MWQAYANPLCLFKLASIKSLIRVWLEYLGHGVVCKRLAKLTL
jgi:hypothetical protein